MSPSPVRPPSRDLRRFLKPFPKDVRDTAVSLRKFVLEMFPDSFELIYDTYNALAFGFGPTENVRDVFCGVVVYSKHVNLSFNRGSELEDPKKILVGSGSLYRHVTIRSLDQLPASTIRQIIRAARKNSIRRLGGPQKEKGITITKSISRVRKRPKGTKR